MASRPRVLLAGESWVTSSTHTKGFNDFSTSFYEEGHSFLFAALDGEYDVEHMPSHMAATRFPGTHDDLRRYDAILFSDIGADTLLLHPDTFLRSLPRPNRLAAVREYVRGGGGFGMIGGYMSYGGIGGRAHYHRTAIDEILPVSAFPYDDRVEVPEGVAPLLVDPLHPILDNVGAQWPPLLGYNRVTLKESAHLVLSCGDDPLLATGGFGRGRTLAFTSDCAPHWGSPEFVAWEGYASFWRNAVRWLAGLGT